MITAYNTKNRPNQFDFYTDNNFFKEEFIAIVKWDKVIFKRPTIDTRVKIRRAAKNGNKWTFSLAIIDGQAGKYEVEQDNNENLIIKL